MKNIIRFDWAIKRLLPLAEKIGSAEKTGIALKCLKKGMDIAGAVK